jgi:UDP-N-acetylglucosamine--N-acetylmuramyl-(pentapeptide) pyrophosphoryl-undecaprenol N-acetylglucosamine transferase
MAPTTTPRGAIAVVIAGGGTGGHLYPGIAVARELLRRRPEAVVTFAGTARGLEARIVPKEGFVLDVIRSAGLKGKSLATRLRGVGLIPLSFLDAFRLLGRRRPHLVLGVGGYSSGPVVLAAALRRIPTMVLEQNAAPGLTNRLLARWIRDAAVTYDETLSYFRGRGFVAGNPVRPEFLAVTGTIPTPAHGGGRVLVLGGSQGAHAINVAVTAAAPILLAARPSLTLVHQTGERDLAWSRREYGRDALPVRAEAFIDRVAAEMTAADVVISRAGATTLAELAAIGAPAILIPFPQATDDHQRRNAEVLAAAGAAILIHQRDLTAELLARTITSLLDDPARLTAMRAAMRRFARPDAAGRIVERALALVEA